MANIINAITTGAGGLSTTADTSGNINFQSGGSTVASITSSGLAVTGTLTVNGASPGRSGSTSTTLTSGSPTLTLTSSSTQLQVISSSTGTGSIVLPDATTMTKGDSYFVFYNTSNYPIAVKDSTGVTREFLPVNPVAASGVAVASPGSISCLELIDNSTAAGVWRLANPITAANFSDTALWTGTWDTTKFNGGSYSNWGLVRVNSTTALALYTSSTNTRQVYGRAITFNATTKTVTYGSVETLIWTHPTTTTSFIAVTGNNVNGYGPWFSNVATNGSDRGIILFNSFTQNYANTTASVSGYSGWCGFAIVSGEAYFSSVDQITGNNGTGGSNGGYTSWIGTPYYSGSNNAFLTYAIGYANANSGRNNVQSSMRAYTVGVSGTTVSLTAATGNSDVNTSVDITYFLTSSPKAHTTAAMSATNFNGTYNSTYGNYMSYNPSTNTITSGTRSPNVIWGTTSPYSAVIANANNYDYCVNSWGNTAGTIVGNGIPPGSGSQMTYTIANGGTATVTGTYPNTTVTYKPVETSVYSTNNANYQVNATSYRAGSLDNAHVKFSSTNEKIIGYNNLWAFDPSTSTLNFNYASYSGTQSQMFLDENNILAYTTSIYQFVPFANPFIA